MLSKRTFFLFVLLSFFSTNYLAFSAEKKDGEFNMGEMIMHHVLDDYRYEIMHGVIIPLPIIVYTDSGLEIFSSSNLFDEDHNALKEGYKLEFLEAMVNADVLVEDFIAKIEGKIAKEVKKA